DRPEGTADDDTNGHVDDVATHGEFFEFLEHVKASLPERRTSIAPRRPQNERLIGEGCGMNSKSRAAPSSAMFFWKWTWLLILACGSLSAQNRCIIKVTGTRNRTMQATPHVGAHPSSTQRPPMA